MGQQLGAVDKEYAGQMERSLVIQAHAFVPVTLSADPDPSSSSPAPPDIRIEVHRANTTIVINWPLQVMFVVINVVKIALQSPEDVDRQVIADCWAESQADSTTPEKRPVVVGACEALEKVFQVNYGIKLTPGAKDV
ncbi:MAG: hypothetical protein JJD98_17560 [Polaromonas sp.]|nr:hypothetical protein [Polaromonas sp.]